jgi:hypothetical protein
MPTPVGLLLLLLSFFFVAINFLFRSFFFVSLQVFSAQLWLTNFGIQAPAVPIMGDTD